MLNLSEEERKELKNINVSNITTDETKLNRFKETFIYNNISLVDLFLYYYIQLRTKIVEIDEKLRVKILKYLDEFTFIERLIDLRELYNNDNFYKTKTLNDISILIKEKRKDMINFLFFLDKEFKIFSIEKSELDIFDKLGLGEM